MKCQLCGKESTVHVAGLDLSGWNHTWYCEECRSHQSPRNVLRCSGCGSLYSDFLETGKLGCADCYTSFAVRLEPLMEKYGNRTPAPLLVGYDPGRMARARTQELCENMYGDPSIPEESLPPVFERRFPAASAREPSSPGEAILESCRFRVARNLRGLPYLPRLHREERERLYAILLSQKGGLALHLGESAGELSSCDFRIYGGDEDHLRAEWLFHPADDTISATIRSILSMRDRLDALYQWQFHSDYGFLTACPGNAGSGVRLSFQLKVPVLLHSVLWPRWKQELERAGYEIRGERGEGSPVTGRLQISNRNWGGDEDLLSGALAMFQVIRKMEQRERELSVQGK